MEREILPYCADNGIGVMAYGPLAYDRTHVATASFSWLLPEPDRDSGVKYHVLGGWQLGAQSGPRTSIGPGKRFARANPAPPQVDAALSFVSIAASAAQAYGARPADRSVGRCKWPAT